MWLKLIIAFFLFFHSIAVYSERLPELFTSLDPVVFDFSTQQQAFDISITQEFGESPSSELDVLTDKTDIKQNIINNLGYLQGQGIKWILFSALEGSGQLWFESTSLLALEHSGFDYNSQYSNSNADSELIVEESQAKKRFVIAYDILPFLLTQAHQHDIKAVANIEALAHIINHSTGQGIGAESDDSLTLADNLPAPSLTQFSQFINEIINLNVDAVFAEAFSTEYDQLLAQSLSNANIPYWHTGAGLGDVWVSYYYSLYPAVKDDYLAYQYLHSDDGLTGLANADYAWGRAQNKTRAIVLGAYNPMPCDTSLNISDYYNANRGNDLAWIDDNTPLLANGGHADNCTTEFWLNLALYGTITQGPDMLWLAADLDPSVKTSLNSKTIPDLNTRLQSHALRPKPLAKANIIIDLPDFDSSIDGYSRDDFLSVVNLSILPLVNDGLEAAGLQTVLSFEEPWKGEGVVVNYIITAGGNEDNGEDGAMWAPHWSRAQDISLSLMSLIDSTNSQTTFIHPVMGIPNTGQWQQIRENFNLPTQFAYKNTALASDENIQTSLLTSILIDSEAETILDSNGKTLKSLITSESILLADSNSILEPYIISAFGQTANLISSSEIPAAQIIYSGNLLTHQNNNQGVIQTSQQQESPLLISNGQNKFLWTINHIHHQAFTYMLSSTINQSLNQTKTLVQPASVHFRGGIQTLALAYNKTELKWQMPVTNGTKIRIRHYNHKSELIKDEYVSYSGTLSQQLGKRDLLVAEAVEDKPHYNLDTGYLYLPSVNVGGTIYEAGMDLLQLSPIYLDLQTFSLVQNSNNTLEFDLTTGELSIPELTVSSANSEATVSIKMKQNTNGQFEVLNIQ